MSRQKLDESGSLLVPLVVVAVLFVTAASFGAWAFLGRQDYKNNSDKKSAVAVEAANKVQKEKDAAEFAEREKSPLKAYAGPAAYGSLNIQYPKIWSAYVLERTDSSAANVVGYMQPGFVPDISARGVQLALKFQILNSNFATVTKSFESFVKTGKTTAQAYSLPKVPGVTGMKYTGAVDITSSQKTGTMVALPLRDKTIEVWTEGDAFVGDFNTIILPNMTFVP